MDREIDFEHELIRVSTFPTDAASARDKRAYRVRGLQHMRVGDLLDNLSSNEAFPLYCWKTDLLVLVPLVGGRPFPRDQRLADIPAETEFLVTLGGGTAAPDN
jgi:hypothetical protein